MALKDTNRSGLERVILLVLFVGLLIFAIVNYKTQRSAAKQELLSQQLTSLRMGLNLYSVMEHRFPSNLVELAVSTYRLPDEMKKYSYVSSVPVNKKGELVDPFGNPYAYNLRKHWINSATPGYTEW